MIAMIAERDLTTAQVQWMTDLFSLWPGEEGTLQGVSSWQDNIKETGYKIFPMGTWHYADIAYVKEPEAEVQNWTVPPPTYNVTTEIKNAIRTIMDPETTSSWALSLALRNLIHFVADCHCPMHAVSLYTNEFPEGDGGGNGYKLSNKTWGNNGANLHKVWDSGGFKYQSQNPQVDLRYNVSKYLLVNTKESLKDRIAIEDPGVWAVESWTIASTIAYTVGQWESPSEEYLQKAREICETQFSVGGYRLGKILKNFFDERGLVELEDPSWAASGSVVSEVIAWILVVACIVLIVVGKVLLSRRGSRFSDKELYEGAMPVPMLSD